MLPVLNFSSRLIVNQCCLSYLYWRRLDLNHSSATFFVLYRKNSALFIQKFEIVPSVLHFHIIYFENL
jgi:hypothetical protein